MAIVSDPTKIRAKVFLKYLVHVAKKRGFRQVKPSFKSAPVLTKNEVIERSNFLDKRSIEITEERIKELESKINIHYTQNKYLPFEERLKSLRRRIYALRRRKDAKKDKLKFILEKIKSCEVLLKKMKQNDINEVDI